MSIELWFHRNRQTVLPKQPQATPYEGPAHSKRGPRLTEPAARALTRTWVLYLERVDWIEQSPDWRAGYWQAQVHRYRNYPERFRCFSAAVHTIETGEITWQE